MPIQLTLPFQVTPSFAEDDFVTGEANRAVVAWLLRWPHWPASALTLFGPPGCGKTHLSRLFIHRTGAVELTTETIANVDPDQLWASAPAAVLEAADQCTSAETERRLLQLYNLAAEHGRALLLTASAPPCRWPIRLADLRSRLGSCPAVAIAAPDDSMLGSVIAKLFRDRQLLVDDTVIPFLLTRMERSFDSARRLVAAIDDVALRMGRRVTISLVRQVLEGNGPADDDPWYRSPTSMGEGEAAGAAEDRRLS